MFVFSQVHVAHSFRIKVALIISSALHLKNKMNKGHFNLKLECLNRGLMLFNQFYIIRFYLIWINFL